MLPKAISLPLVLVVLLGGCSTYPPAEEVVACAASRFGSDRGIFSVKEVASSLLSGQKFAITYQKSGSPDRAIFIYDRTTGPISVQQEITYGNRVEITDAVDALRICAQGWGKADHGP
jgi:hypothetical protein